MGYPKRPSLSVWLLAFQKVQHRKYLTLILLKRFKNLKYVIPRIFNPCAAMSITDNLHKNLNRFVTNPAESRESWKPFSLMKKSQLTNRTANVVRALKLGLEKSVAKSIFENPTLASLSPSLIKDLISKKDDNCLILTLNTVLKFAGKTHFCWCKKVNYPTEPQILFVP